MLGQERRQRAAESVRVPNRCCRSVWGLWGEESWSTANRTWIQLTSRHTGRPHPLQNCTIVQQSPEALQVDCAEGFDGGLTQGFLLEVVETSTLRFVRNLTLLVGGLRAAFSST